MRSFSAWLKHWSAWQRRIEKGKPVRFSKKVCSVSATVAASAALALGVAGAAGASTHGPSHGSGGTSNCAHGIYAGFCGTQKSNTGLYIAVTGRNDEVIGTTHPQADNAEFFWFAVGGGTNKYAEFAPNGIASNLVMAEEHHNIVLETASGATSQQWFFDSKGWKNIATGDVLEATTDGGAIVSDSHGPSHGNSETWTFETP
jgi:hypothetical protein